MEGVKVLKTDEKSIEMMKDLYADLLNSKITRSRRSLESMKNQPKKEKQITKEDLIARGVKHTNQYKYSNLIMPESMTIGTRWDYFKNEYVVSAHDKHNGTELFDKCKSLTTYLANINDISYNMNTATLNRNYKISKHLDRRNKNSSILIGFGDYEKGEITIYDKKDISYNYDINMKPILFNGSDYYHEVIDFSGTRYSFVSYLI